jgi:hypothetical protein
MYLFHLLQLNRNVSESGTNALRVYVSWKSRNSPSACLGSAIRMESYRTGWFIYIAAFAPTDQSSSIESFQTNRQFASQNLIKPIHPIFAISRIVEEFNAVLHSDYCTGLRRSEFPQALLWQRNVFEGRLLTRLESYPAPSRLWMFI